ncbi:MAG: serine/threonine protein kinase [Crenarchaeota archaeon]|nr:serine/threonine protein kinase [Thermoproteota archaeon]
MIIERGKYRISLAPILGTFLEGILKTEFSRDYIVIRLTPAPNTPAEALYNNKLVIVDRYRGRFERLLDIAPAVPDESWTFTCDSNYIRVIVKDLYEPNLRIFRIDYDFNITENIIKLRHFKISTIIPYSSCQYSDKIYVMARYLYPNYSILMEKAAHIWLPALYVIHGNDILEEYLIGENELAKCSISSLKIFDIKTGCVSINPITEEIWIPAKIDIEYRRLMQKVKLARYVIFRLDPRSGYYHVQHIDSPIVSKNFLRKIVFDSSGNAYVEVKPNVIYVFDRDSKLICEKCIPYLIDYVCNSDIIITLSREGSSIIISLFDKNFKIIGTKSLEVDPTYLKDVYMINYEGYVYIIFLDKVGSLLIYVLEIDTSEILSRLIREVEQPLQYLTEKNVLEKNIYEEQPKLRFPNLKYVVNSILGKCIGWIGSELPIRKLKNPITISNTSCFGVLGSGGFGVALLCVDESGRNVVVKLPRDLYDAFRDGLYDLSLTLHDYDSFVKEATILSRLDHIHIVRLLRWSNDPVFLMYEFCDGGDLRTLLSRSGKLSVDKVVLLGLQVALALEHAYQRGVRYHGDIKPSNILFTRNGLLKVSDFGISRLASSTTGYTYPHGTLGYSAPEQLIHGLGSPGPRSDIFSLGIVMYESLTGTNPLKGCVPSEYESVLKNVDLSTGIRELDKLVLNMMSFRPECRPDIDHVISRLAEIYVNYFS